MTKKLKDNDVCLAGLLNTIGVPDFYRIYNYHVVSWRFGKLGKESRKKEV